MLSLDFQGLIDSQKVQASIKQHNTQRLAVKARISDRELARSALAYTSFAGEGLRASRCASPNAAASCMLARPTPFTVAISAVLKRANAPERPVPLRAADKIECTQTVIPCGSRIERSSCRSATTSRQAASFSRAALLRQFRIASEPCGRKFSGRSALERL